MKKQNTHLPGKTQVFNMFPFERGGLRYESRMNLTVTRSTYLTPENVERYLIESTDLPLQAPTGASPEEALEAARDCLHRTWTYLAVLGRQGRINVTGKAECKHLNTLLSVFPAKDTDLYTTYATC